MHNQLTPDQYATLGRIVRLMSHAEGSYPTWRTWEIERQIVPAIAAQQAFVLHDGHDPISFATWAWLTEADGRAYCETGRPMQQPWNTGDQLWMIDFACIPGYFPSVQRWMAINWFPGCTVNALRHNRKHVVHTGEARSRRRQRALQRVTATEEFKHAG